MKNKPFWDKPNPADKPKKLTAAQKLAAKRRAKEAGRPLRTTLQLEPPSESLPE